jgi:microcystin-dependent protein
MKGDFTRFTFDPGKHYDSVLMQQGRVQTDADWNEQVMIAAHRNRIEMLDIIGPTGAPQDLSAGGRGAFLVYYAPDAGNTNRLFINHGRYYVDGLMVEGEGPVRYDVQPGAALPPAAGAGAYLLYLDIWKRHVSALEDPNIREVALAGADSGTRTQLVWQVRVERIGDLGINLANIQPSQYGPDWQPAGTASTGALDVQAGSTPLENQLYRVEVHRGGTASTASFKWSRDNGTVVARVTTHSPPVLATVVRDGINVQVWQFSVTVDQTGRDSFSSFLPGHMVELGNEEFVLQRRPGVFGAITSVVGDTLNLEVPGASAQLASADPDINPLAGASRTVRRWDNTWNPDQAGTTLLDVGPDYTQAGRLLLERDITVRFATTRNNQPCTYQTGDYWLMPARTVSGLEGWTVGQQQPPAGDEHFYAPLALAKFQANGTIANPASDLRDMRDVFPTLRSLVGGTGSIVQGTGVQHRLPKWQSTGGSVLLNSNVSDDGATITLGGTALSVTPAATFASTLRVGTGGTAQTISRFTSSAIKSMAAQELGETVPTSQAVKDFVNWAVPPGTVMAYASETAPEGWLECDGRSLDGSPGTTYRNLFTAIGKSFGSGNGSANGFNLPDLRGRFVRGWSHTTANDPDAASRWNFSGGNTGNRVGSYQDDLNRSHTHSFTASGYASFNDQNHSHWMSAYDSWTHSPENQPPPAGTKSIRYNSGTRYLWFGRRDYTELAYTSHSHTLNFSAQTTGSSGGNESRPKNASLMYIIKY